MKRLIFCLVLLMIGNVRGSEDNDLHPNCPYVLEEGETCTDKSLRIIEAEKSLQKRNQTIIREEAAIATITIPEPTTLGLLLCGIIGFLIHKKRK